MEYRCDKCGYHMYTQSAYSINKLVNYQQVINEIDHDVYGEDWRKLFYSTPNVAIKIDCRFYVCPSCGGFKNEPVLSLYQLKDSEKLTRQFDLPDLPSEVFGIVSEGQHNDHYQFVKRYVHRCPDCGKSMRLYREGDFVRCPECKEGCMEIHGPIFWD